MAATPDVEFDVIIIGAGPAGLAAALYTARDRYKTLLLEKRGLPGGQIMLTERIENYPGFEFISGPDLVNNMVRQCQTFGADLRNNTEVEKLERLDDGTLRVTTAEHQSFTARAIILSPGSDYRPLGVPGEMEFRGSGVSYCGTCDAPFFRGKHVVAVGGGNTAVEESIHLANFAAKVTMVHRRNEFRAQKVLVEELNSVVAKKGNIQLRMESAVEAILGTDKVNGVRLKNLASGQVEDYDCDGVFIFVGMDPNTGWLKGFLELDEYGFVKADPKFMRTMVPGVFVVGDCRTAAPLQLATACGDGVTAALMMKRYLKDPDWWFHDLEPAEDGVEPVGW